MVSVDEFIARSKSIFGDDRYDYSKLVLPDGLKNAVITLIFALYAGRPSLTIIIQQNFVIEVIIEHVEPSLTGKYAARNSSLRKLLVERGHVVDHMRLSLLIQKAADAARSKSIKRAGDRWGR
jgi:hypothetical protein